MTADIAGLMNAVVAAAALITLLLVIVAYEAVGALVTLAHEGAHALVNTLAGRRVESLEVTGGFSGVTRSIDRGWGPGRILSGAAGYTTPPLLGLGGAALLAAGEVLLLLWTAVILILLAWIKAEKEWTTFLVLLLAAPSATSRSTRRRCCRFALQPGWCGCCCSAASVMPSSPAPATRPTPPSSPATH